MSVRDTIEAQMSTSVGAMLRRRIKLTPQRDAYRRPEGDGWVTLTWAQTGEIVDQVAAALLSLGLQPEQRVAIASNTRLEWILADFAVNAAGLATTTVYPNTADDDVAHILGNSDSRVLFAENVEQLAKLRKHPELQEQVQLVVLFDGEAPDDERVTTWREFVERGKAHLAAHPTCVDDAIEATTPDSLATLIYTSGTTGRPKGVELLHRSWTYLPAAVDSVGFTTVDDVQYLWLPLSHVFGKCLISIQVWSGFVTAVDGRLDRIVPNLAVVKPTLMLGAPRIFEKVRATVLTGESSHGIKGRISRWAFHVGLQSNPYRVKGEPMPRALALQYKLADRLVFSKLRERLGGNMKFMVSGSAKLSSQVQEWFYAAGLLIVEGYGLTENSAVAFINHWSTPRFGTVGPVLPGLECRLGDDGEVLLRGPVVMRGYHDDPEATAEAIVDGWFHTGDIGELDADGYLRITDRKKDLMKTSGGKYVAPQKVEGALVANIPYISQAVAVGDGQRYIAALLVLEPDALNRWAEQNGHGGMSYAELSRLPELRAAIDPLLERANSKLERWETVKKYAILDTQLSVDQGVVTPNMKVRRSAVVQANTALVDSLFEGAE